MKLTVDRNALVKALAHVQNLVERRAINPILANVLLQVEGDQLSLTTTDLDLSVKELIGVSGADAGETTVNVHTFYEIVKKLQDGAAVELKASEESSQLAIKCGKSRFQLPTLPASDFMRFDFGALPNSFQMEAESLRSLINQTRFCMSTEETRYNLNGIYFHVLQQKGAQVLKAVATDGHRLALSSFEGAEGLEDVPGIIIPRKAVNELSRLLEGEVGGIDVSMSLTQIRFAFANITLYTRLVDGKFPDYDQVIPSANEGVLKMNRHQLAQSVDRVSLLSQDKTRGIKVVFEKNRVTVSASSQEFGSATEDVDASYDGARIETAFNARYLMDILQHIESENLQIQLGNENTPVIIQGEDEVESLFVIMPMRL